MLNQWRLFRRIGPSAKQFTTVSDGEIAPEMWVIECQVFYWKKKENKRFDGIRSDEMIEMH